MSATLTRASHPLPILIPTAARATASTSLLESPMATERDRGDADVLADSFDSYCFGEVSGEDFEGDVTGSTHGSDNRPVAGWQCRVHPFHGGIFRGERRPLPW